MIQPASERSILNDDDRHFGIYLLIHRYIAHTMTTPSKPSITYVVTG